MDIAQYRLDGNADAVEFCPNDPFHHILAAATYTLQEGDHPCRLGSISLFSIKIKEGLKLLQHVETSGVFDIKWNPSHCNIHPQLAQADSDGYLTLHGLQCSSSISEFDAAAAELPPPTASLTTTAAATTTRHIPFQTYGFVALQRKQEWYHCHEDLQK
ncbi:hypothetical protein AMTR_s00044p00133430 [Amborella trichopoda]|uniref:Uncharacterized protein n=1 Tax=Amborella trichopoda TaxID=13333 RepID=U5D9U8_AMBTC|nr:hypothetical protein AMTR_s00044p00133430 [Amborella trichopoda]